MGVSKNSGTPKLVVKIMENPIKMDDLGGKPTIFGNIHKYIQCTSDVNTRARCGSRNWVAPRLINLEKPMIVQSHGSTKISKNTNEIAP